MILFDQYIFFVVQKLPIKFPHIKKTHYTNNIGCSVNELDSISLECCFDSENKRRKYQLVKNMKKFDNIFPCNHLFVQSKTKGLNILSFYLAFS